MRRGDLRDRHDPLGAKGRWFSSSGLSPRIPKGDHVPGPRPLEGLALLWGAQEGAHIGT